MEVDANAPPYAASSLPAYTADAQSNERTINPEVAVSAQSGINISPTQEYQYKLGRLTLNLGPKCGGIFRKAYGWNGTVEGSVQVKKNTKNVLSITVSVEGQVNTGICERGFLTEQTKTTVLRLSQTLFDASAGQQLPIAGAHYAFSFPLPSYVAGGMQPLPPTFAAIHPGVGADVTYYIKVDMVRKGMLRPNEKLKAFFYYLPRTYAPLPRCAMLAQDDTKAPTEDDSSDWRIVSVMPKLPRCTVSTSVASLSVSFALVRPLVYAAGTSIPFCLTVASETTTEALSSLFSCLSVQLVRVTSLMAGQRRTACEAVIGGGEVFRVQERGSTRTMFGSVTCAKRGESSWRVRGIEVKYVIRVRLGPRGDMPSLAGSLPTYTHEEVVELRTHERTWEGDDAETQPALCRAPRPALALGACAYT